MTSVQKHTSFRKYMKYGIDKINKKYRIID